MPDDTIDLTELRPNVKVIAIGIAAVLAVLVVYLFVSSGVSYVGPDEVGLLVHNLTGRMELKSDPGYVFHLPLGMDDVYAIRKTQRTLAMKGAPLSGPGSLGDNVRLKTREGADVFVDVEVTYRVDAASPEAYLRAMGPDSRVWEEKEVLLLRAFARSITRDTLGRMTVEEMVNSGIRSARLAEARLLCSEVLAPYGLEVLTISSINIKYTEQYDQRIRDRKEADQAIEKERSAQEKAKAEQQKRQAAAQREKEVRLTEERGRQQKNIIEAGGRAAEMRARADGEARRIRLDADREYAVAVADASAALAEGLRRAEGIRRLAEAYDSGGMALVREALAKKYLDARVVGRPFSLESTVDRVQIEDARASGGSPAPPPLEHVIPALRDPQPVDDTKGGQN